MIMLMMSVNIIHRNMFPKRAYLEIKNIMSGSLITLARNVEWKPHAPLIQVGFKIAAVASAILTKIHIKMMITQMLILIMKITIKN